MKERLNGRWVKKDNSLISVFVEKVFKVGYVTGFTYIDAPNGVIHSRFRATHEELQRDYKRLRK